MVVGFLDVNDNIFEIYLFDIMLSVSQVVSKVVGTTQ